MNLRLPFIIAFILILSLAVPNTAETQATYSDGFLSGVREFTTNFAKTVFKTNDGNLVFAPISALISLTTLAFGADGNSKEEVIQATHLPLTDENLDSFGRFFNTLNSVSSIELHLANKLYVQKEFDVEPAFLNFTKNTFKSEAEGIDFKNVHEAVAKINKWAEDQTENKIHNLISAGDLDKTVMVLLNAVYSKGKWKYSFPTELKQKNFYLSATKSISVPMMCNKAPYNYGSTIGGIAEYAELPFTGPQSEFSLYLIVPVENDGLSAVSTRLQEIDFSTMSSNTPKPNITVCMPKPNIEKSYNLIPVFQEMGIHEIFSDHANLSNINAHEDLVVNKFIHKAFFSANEEGSEAAAATAVGIGTRIIGPHEFNVDKPSLMVVVHKSTGIPIFVARINNP